MTPRDHDRRELDQIVTVVEVAAVLRVSRATVYRLVHTGELSGMRQVRAGRPPGGGEVHTQLHLTGPVVSTMRPQTPLAHAHTRKTS